MRKRFRLIRRGERNQFYCVDSETGQRTSLKTNDRDAAEQIALEKNQALRQPALNLQIAKAYLAGTDNGVNTRTWLHAIESLIGTKHGANKDRWLRVIKDPALATLLPQVIIETKGEALLRAAVRNRFHQRLPAPASQLLVDMSWLPWPLIPKRQWPAVKFKDKRAIKLDEHQKIIAAEVNPERKLFYQLCWHLGASQGDIAGLKGEDGDLNSNTLGFTRKKTGVAVIVHLGAEALNLFKDLPSEGLLFPYLSRVRAGDRATEFRSRCKQLGIHGVTLHSYRYAWAERAKTAGMPERFAMENLGHNSKAVHRAYAKKALVKIPSLEEYEQKAQ